MGCFEKWPLACSDLSDEWSICTKSDLQTKDVKGYALISNAEYKMPTTTPDPYDCTAETFCTFTTSTKTQLPSAQSWLDLHDYQQSTGGDDDDDTDGISTSAIVVIVVIVIGSVIGAIVYYHHKNS